MVEVVVDVTVVTCMFADAVTIVAVDVVVTVVVASPKTTVLVMVSIEVLIAMETGAVCVLVFKAVTVVTCLTMTFTYTIQVTLCGYCAPDKFFGFFARGAKLSEPRRGSRSASRRFFNLGGFVEPPPAAITAASEANGVKLAAVLAVTVGCILVVTMDVSVLVMETSTIKVLVVVAIAVSVTVSVSCGNVVVSISMLSTVIVVDGVTVVRG
jgi:hypothetical protein